MGNGMLSNLSFGVYFFFFSPLHLILLFYELLNIECAGIMQQLRLIHQMVIMFPMMSGVIEKRYLC